MQIWKYPLQVKEFIELEIPKGSKLLTLQVQNEAPTLWFEVDSETIDREVRKFYIAVTGGTASETGRYIGTFQLQGGRFVGHLYEVT